MKILIVAVGLASIYFLFAGVASDRKLQLGVGKSHVIEAPEGVDRVAVSAGDILEAVAVSPTEVLLNGKAPGEASVFVWRKDKTRQQFDVQVNSSPLRPDKIRAELEREIGHPLEIEVDDTTVFLRGTVDDVQQAERAVAIASSLGKVVNLLRVTVPKAPPQVLLRIKFADLDRSAATELGANFFSTGAANTPGSVSTQQFTPPQPKVIQGKNSQFTISDALNIFLFRPDLNLGTTIKALQSKNLIQILAEPNLLAATGKEASFLAGGEFPYPVVQGGGVGQNTVTIQFRPFGIRINFIPTITPRGSIHLQVAPEVSSLDYANGVTYQGFTVPGLAVRKVQTEIELDNRQSFAIAGLLDNRVTEALTKVPGLGSIPFFGKLFQSKMVSRNKSELLVVVTPELVQPMPEGAPLPSLDMPGKMLGGGDTVTPGPNVPASSEGLARASLPYEVLVDPKGPALTPAPPANPGSKR